jgi:hypothetical protein
MMVLIHFQSVHNKMLLQNLATLLSVVVVVMWIVVMNLHCDKVEDKHEEILRPPPLERVKVKLCRKDECTTMHMRLDSIDPLELSRLGYTLHFV